MNGQPGGPEVDASAGEGGVFRRLLRQVRRRSSLKRLQDRAMDVVLQLTRITNDGSYRAMRDAQRVSGGQAPQEGRRKGLPGG